MDTGHMPSTGPDSMTPAALKSLRAALGWSQQRLADEIGVARNTVNRWEMGLHPISSTAMLLLRTIERRNNPSHFTV